mmetsp:Transcript_42869/g.62987  ORF Transcript_42869/g.62987 Transcript_42869/m.62987 type:complete len:106 (-) Transcript_42869:102-419(-)
MREKKMNIAMTASTIRRADILHDYLVVYAVPAEGLVIFQNRYIHSAKKHLKRWCAYFFEIGQMTMKETSYEQEKETHRGNLPQSPNEVEKVCIVVRAGGVWYTYS